MLAIDGCSLGRGDALLAAATLVRLEATLWARRDPGACVIDFFNATVGAGAGSVLAAMLLLRGDDGHARYSTADALGFVASSLSSRGCGNGGASLQRVFGDARLKDTMAPSSAVRPC
ncbi:hypothetical protein BS78_03G349300 [Paspalum vaginatum]|nr:hypothetical protein BS78_03G349300 [Paspalum vaginatum]